MLEQVSIAALATLLVLRTDVIPQIDRDDGQRPMFLDNDVKSVGQGHSGKLKVGKLENRRHGAEKLLESGNRLFFVTNLI